MCSLLINYAKLRINPLELTLTKFFIAYETYFGMKMGDQDKSWAPHFWCRSFRFTLEEWMRGSRKCMPFAILRIWREHTNHHNDCYFCMVCISKDKEQEKDCLSKCSFIYYACQPWHRTAYSSTSNNACYIINPISRWRCWFWGWHSVFQQRSSFSESKWIWMILLETWVLQRQKQRYFLLVSKYGICLLLLCTDNY